MKIVKIEDRGWRIAGERKGDLTRTGRMGADGFNAKAQRRKDAKGREELATDGTDFTDGE
jgi:hypothetical protein